MELKDLYREIVNDHNINPLHKYEMEDPDIVLRGVNPSCGDDIILMLKVKDGIITFFIAGENGESDIYEYLVTKDADVSGLHAVDPSTLGN